MARNDLRKIFYVVSHSGFLKPEAAAKNSSAFAAVGGGGAVLLLWKANRELRVFSPVGESSSVSFDGPCETTS